MIITLVQIEINLQNVLLDAGLLDLSENRNNFDWKSPFVRTMWHRSRIRFTHVHVSRGEAIIINSKLLSRSIDRLTERPWLSRRWRIGTTRVPHFSDAGQIGHAGELISANHRHAPRRRDSPEKSVCGIVDTYDRHATHDEPELKLRRRNSRITWPCSGPWNVLSTRSSVTGGWECRWWIRWVKDVFLKMKNRNSVQNALAMNVFRANLLIS